MIFRRERIRLDEEEALAKKPRNLSFGLVSCNEAACLARVDRSLLRDGFTPTKTSGHRMNSLKITEIGKCDEMEFWLGCVVRPAVAISFYSFSTIVELASRFGGRRLPADRQVECCFPFKVATVLTRIHPIALFARRSLCNDEMRCASLARSGSALAMQKGVIRTLERKQVAPLVKRP